MNDEPFAIRVFYIMEKEIWKQIPGYGNLYHVSSLGRIKRLASVVAHPKGGLKNIKERILKNEGSLRYRQYTLCFEGKRDPHLLHRIVASAFHPNPGNKPCVNHIDGDTHNNSAHNLEWVTYSENEHHSVSVLGKRTNMVNLAHYSNEWENPININGYNIRGKYRKMAFEMLKHGTTIDEVVKNNIAISSFYKLVMFLRKHGVVINTTLISDNSKKVKYIIV